jgi:hypothetical protein
VARRRHETRPLGRYQGPPASFAPDKERMARCEREAKVLASLNQPRIAQIYGIEGALSSWSWSLAKC